MDEWIGVLRGSLLFDNSCYERFQARHDVFLRGALLVTVVALLAGLPVFILELGTALSGRDVMERGAVAAQLEQGLQSALPYLPNISSEILQQIRQGFEAFTEVVARVQVLPTLIPRPIGGALEALGRWLSRPFANGLPLVAVTLGTWLGYGICALLFARLLGGRGDVAGFLGTTSLFAVPHLLNVFAPVPYLGPVMGGIAFAWGAAIFVKAAAVSQRITLVRALLAALLALLAVAVLLVVVVIGLPILIAAAIAGL